MAEGEPEVLAVVQVGGMTEEGREATKKRMVGYGEMLGWQFDELSENVRQLTIARIDLGGIKAFGRLSRRGRRYRELRELVKRSLGGFENTVDVMEFGSRKASQIDNDQKWSELWKAINIETIVILKAIEMEDLVALPACLGKINGFLQKCKETKTEG